MHQESRISSTFPYHDFASLHFYFSYLHFSFVALLQRAWVRKKKGKKALLFPRRSTNPRARKTRNKKRKKTDMYMHIKRPSKENGLINTRYSDTRKNASCTAYTYIYWYVYDEIIVKRLSKPSRALEAKHEKRLRMRETQKTTQQRTH